MKIICWNVHFDINKEKYSHIANKECDILILLECTHKSFELVKEEWEYSLWYNDTLYENKSDYGIAVFSKKYKFDFTESFNRKLRYVIPLKIFDKKEFLFYLFAVWTKSKPILYSLNVIKALEFPEYNKYVSDKAIFIGDFNTPTKKDKHVEYDNLIKKGLVDCAGEDCILKPTYSHSSTNNYYTADYCFATKKMVESFEIRETIFDLNDAIEGKDKYGGLSDHCPILVEIKRD